MLFIFYTVVIIVHHMFVIYILYLNLNIRHSLAQKNLIYHDQTQFSTFSNAQDE